MSFLNKPKNWKPNYVRISTILIILILLILGGFYLFNHNNQDDTILTGTVTDKNDVKNEVKKEDITVNISAIGAINSNIAGIAEEIWFYYPSLENASGVALNLGFSYFALIVAILSALIYALNLAFVVVKFIIGRSTKNAIENVDINLSESVGE